MNISLDTALISSIQTPENSSNNYLDCKSRKITSISPILDGSCEKLRRLDISFNPLSSMLNCSSTTMPQLRHLSAFACELIDLGNGLPSKLEILHLHQNRLSEISKISIQSLSKLKHLRIDRNQLSSLKSIQYCSSLETLDASFNELTSLEGIDGLMSLEDVKVGHNRIQSLQSFKSLPSLKEIDVSYNKITSLHGIQHWYALETIKADHNDITSIHFPQSSTSSTNLSASNASKKISLTSSTSSKKAGKCPVEEKLTDIHLSHNKIRDLKGLECLGKVIEVLDLSHNQISSWSLLYSELSHASFREDLIELRIDGNEAVDLLEPRSAVLKLIQNFPKLKTFNDNSIFQAPRDSAAEVSADSSQVNFSLKPLAQDFHTWSSEGNAVFDKPSEDKLDTESVHGDEKEKEEEKDEELRPPQDPSLSNLVLKDMKSIDEIVVQEKKFRDLLSGCKAILAQMLKAPEPRPFVEYSESIHAVKVVESSIVADVVAGEHNRLILQQRQLRATSGSRQSSATLNDESSARFSTSPVKIADPKFGIGFDVRSIPAQLSNNDK